MKKLMIILILIAFIFIFGLCTPELELKTDGLYLKITSTGTYFNEISGITSTNNATLETIVNLYPLTKSTAGFFNNGGGVVTGAASGKLTSGNLVFGGVAHVNGLIAKGPLSGNSPVSIKLLDANFNEVAIDPLLQERFDDALSNIGEFDLELPATEDVEIPLNVNILTTMQSKRIQNLVTTRRLSYANAYNTSKEEILDVFNLGDEASIFGDFENMSIIGESNGDALLLMVSAIMSDNPDLIEEIIDDIAENGGITDEDLGDAITESTMNIDFEDVTDNLEDFYEDQGITDVIIPDGSDYQDTDGDGNIGLYEVILISPVGFTSESMPTFEWTAIDITGIQYALQVSTIDDFSDNILINVSNLSSPQYTATAPLTMDATYFWRVAPIVGGIQKNWSALSSFTIDTSPSAPYGDMYIFEGNVVASRVITLDLSAIVGASEMRFSFDGTFDAPEEQYIPFELMKTLIIPEGQTDVTIYAEFTNTYGTFPTTTSVTVTATAPSGSFLINGGDAETSSTEVMLDLSGIDGAYMMRFSNNTSFSNEPWVNYQMSYMWTLTSGNGLKTVYAEFKNSYGTYPAQDSITLNEGTTYSLTIGIIPTGAGTIGVSPNAISGNGTPGNPYIYNSGTYVQLIPNPTGSYTFSNWTGDYVEDLGAGLYQIEMNGNKQIAANFISLPTLIIDINPVGAGTVSVSPNAISGDGTPGNPYVYESGTYIQLIPNPIGTNSFLNWSGPNASDVEDLGAGLYQLAMNGNKQIIANFASTKYVRSDGNDSGAGTSADPYLTIQKAIDMLPSGGQIKVAEGTYNITSSISITTNGIYLQGGWNTDFSYRDPYQTTIDRVMFPTSINYTGTEDGSYNNPNSVISIQNANNVIIEGFIINGGISGTGYYNSAIRCKEGSNPIIRFNSIHGGDGDQAMGIMCESYTANTAPIIVNNSIHGGNGPTSGSVGIYCRNLSSPYIINNVIIGGDEYPTGIYYGFGSSPIILNNTINGGNSTGWSVGIMVQGTGSPVGIIRNNIIFSSGTDGYGIRENDTNSDVLYLENNNIFNCTTALYRDEETTNITTIAGIHSLNPTNYSNNIGDDPMLADIVSGDFHLTVTSPSSVTNGGLDLSAEPYFPRFSGNLIDQDIIVRTVPWSIGAYELDSGGTGGTMHVSTLGNDITGDGSAGNPYATIQKAIDMLPSGGEVRIATGAYNVTNPITISTNGIYLLGGWSNDFSLRYPYQTEADRTTNLTSVNYIGIGTGAYDDPIATILVNIGVWDIIIEGLTVNGKVSGGGNHIAGIYCNSGNADIRYNTINGQGLTASGLTAGVFIKNSNSTIRNNTINGGEGGSSYGAHSISIRGTSNPNIMDNILTNTAPSNTGVEVEAGVGCLPIIIGNTITSQTGVDIFYSNASIINNVIIANIGINVRSSANSGSTPEYAAIINNTIKSITTSSGNGIFIQPSYETTYLNYPRIINNIIIGFNVGIYESNTYSCADPIELRNNDIYGCNYPYYDEGSTYISIIADVNALVDITNGCSGNISEDPMFVNSVTNDLHLSGSSPTSVTEGGLDMSSEPYFPNNGMNCVDKDGIARIVPWSMGAYEC